MCKTVNIRTKSSNLILNKFLQTSYSTRHCICPIVGLTYTHLHVQTLAFEEVYYMIFNGIGIKSVQIYEGHEPFHNRTLMHIPCRNRKLSNAAFVFTFISYDTKTTSSRLHFCYIASRIKLPAMERISF